MGAESNYEHRCNVAMSLLAQCANAFFLIGNYEIRKLDGRWWLMHAGNRILNFDNPFDAYLAAKDLMSMRQSRACLAEADPT